MDYYVVHDGGRTWSVRYGRNGICVYIGSSKRDAWREMDRLNAKDLI